MDDVNIKRIYKIINFLSKSFFKFKFDDGSSLSSNLTLNKNASGSCVTKNMTENIKKRLIKTIIYK